MAGHAPTSRSIEETLSVTESDCVFVPWSFVTESLKKSCREKGAHGCGSLLRCGKGRLTFPMPR